MTGSRPPPRTGWPAKRGGRPPRRGCHSHPQGARLPPQAPRGGLRWDPPCCPWTCLHCSACKGTRGESGRLQEAPSHVGKQHCCQLLQSHCCNDRGSGWPLPDVVGRQPPAGAATEPLSGTWKHESASGPATLDVSWRRKGVRVTLGPQIGSLGLTPGQPSQLRGPQIRVQVPSSTFSNHVMRKWMVHSLGFLTCEMGMLKQRARVPAASAVPATL